MKKFGRVNVLFFLNVFLIIAIVYILSLTISLFLNKRLKVGDQLSNIINKSLNIENVVFYSKNDSVLHRSDYYSIIIRSNVSCGTCFGDYLYQWQAVVDSMSASSIEITPLFIFPATDESKIQDIKKTMDSLNFYYSFDLSTFCSNNSFVNVAKTSFSTFLVDEKFVVKIVGDPVYNKAIIKLYRKLFE